MKILRNIILGLIAAAVVVSCDNVVGLGHKLDLEGPVVNFTSPAPRKTVQEHFVLEGTVSDNGSIRQMIIKLEKDKVQFPRQWRNTGGKWEISNDFGSSWTTFLGAELKQETGGSAFVKSKWEGSNSVIWSIPVDLTIGGTLPEDGQYMFIAQAWDNGDMSDDNSFKTLILIVDNDPPKVSINKPLLYDRHLGYDLTNDKFDDTDEDGIEIEQLRKLTDWRKPELIGKFQTNSFQLQWSIEESFNIFSFDLRFYDMSVEIDEDPESPLPPDYIYRVQKNTTPLANNLSSYVKPNGTVTVPALNGEIKDYGENGVLYKKVENNTVIRVAAICYDSAENVVQEKTLGFFIYWPQADIPWITFSGDINEPEYYDNTPTANAFNANVQDAFLVYPGVKIKAIAFHVQGVKDVTYSISRLEPQGNGSFLNPYSSNTSKTPMVTNQKITNEQSSRGKFDWEFTPEPRSAFYIVTAVTSSTSGKTSDPVTGIFRVQDITFPDFPQSIKPPALEPLFQHITSNSITISGIVADATAIDTLCLVWINPQSKGFAAQSQLEYFRDANYKGWTTALGLTAGGNFALQSDYDNSNPNKVWKLQVTKSTDYPQGINPDTQRVEYKFSKTILLSDLNISLTSQPLKSQVFLLRAANSNPRVTIITYTPQGDESPPTILITEAVIKSGTDTATLTPGQFGEIKKFKTNDTITISGTWREDSVKYLPFGTYLGPSFNISINQVKLPNIVFTGNTSGSDNGTWTATTTVGSGIALTALKDTMVVSATLKDFGGNISEDGASWLIESDTLRLVRISSTDADQTYNTGKKITIFLEFNKPVLLKSGRSANPVLTLKVGNGTANAAYIPNATQNTRQSFEYTVVDGQNTTTASPWLDVSGLSGTLTGNYWQTTGYPFTWVAGAEEIRITKEAQPTHSEGATETNNGINYYLRRIPVESNSNDLPYTLARGKNIGIDTTAPQVTSISSTNKAGHYAKDAEIDINVTFNEAVKIVSGTPQLVLQVTNGANTTYTTPTTGSVKVNDKVVTFTYKVLDTHTTGDNRLIVNSITGGAISDIAGNTMAALSLSQANRTLNGGTANNGTGIFVNTVAPGVPTFRALTSTTANAPANTDIIKNTVSGSEITGESAGAAKDLKNVYTDNLWFAIMPNTTGGNNRVGYLEYTLDTATTPTNWKKIDNTTGTPFKQDIYGKYTVRVRQTDQAGNPSPVSNSVTLNWDPGTLVTRIDSSTANGTYTNNTARQDEIKIQLYFRKTLTFAAGTRTLQLNARRGTAAPAEYATATNTTAATTNAASLEFDYKIADNDNTPAGTGTAQYLDVTSFGTTANPIITATDADGVNVSNYIKLPADSANRLNNRKEILVQTGALAVASGPTYNITANNDEATGTITFTFNRSISKRTGNAVIKQQTTGYRIPAVLTETQATRYKSARGFNTYYSRGTNGFVNDAVDTSTKFVLNYGETTVVNPANAGTPQEQMAYDFLAAETVTLPVTSQDVTVNGNTLTIRLTGSNALQVLGANYDINIPEGFVQDGLSFRWPTTAYTSTTNTPSVNRPFVRVDKRVNEDRITATGNGSTTMPHLRSNFDRVLQTQARFDCRTPNSIVRYVFATDTHTATDATTDANRTGTVWRNGAAIPTNAVNNPNSTARDKADRYDFLTAQDPGTATTGTNNGNGTLGGTTAGTVSYATNATNLTVGDTNQDGFLWRVGLRSRNSTTGANFSGVFEEMAFRTVLTYDLRAANNNTQGQPLGSGDQLWIRGGDAIGSSSVPGFPINWQDDYTKLNTDQKRAGVRLLRRTQDGAANLNTASTWRWITWEINVRTWHDVVMGRGVDTETPQAANDAWQYGPRQWAYPRGGWVALKDDYTLYPGKHRWMRVSNSDYQPGGTVNFSLNFSTRGNPSVTLTQPNP